MQWYASSISVDGLSVYHFVTDISTVLVWHGAESIGISYNKVSYVDAQGIYIHRHILQDSEVSLMVIIASYTLFLRCPFIIALVVLVIISSKDFYTGIEKKRMKTVLS